MATIIAIESSGSTCGVGLIINDIYTQEYSIEEVNIHDRILADSVKRILTDNNLSLNSSIDAVAVSAGPGSFTGIRIGASIAKGLCYGGEPVFIAVPTLKAMAKSCSRENDFHDCDNIVAVISSVNNTCFFAKYNKNFLELSAPELINLKELPMRIADRDLLCGNIAQPIELPHQNKFISIELSPRQIAMLGLEMYNDKLFTNPEEFKPIYAYEFIPKIKFPKHSDNKKIIQGT
jgi:tRNA threonylcarbamoyladenosine biosynthesis protein TsaB